MKIRGGRGRLRSAHKTEEVNPMEGLGNMADAMLVFACGLLLALIMSMNVNVSERGEIEQTSNNKYEVNDINGSGEEELSEDANLEEMGKVYRDPDTGKYYVIEE